MSLGLSVAAWTAIGAIGTVGVGAYAASQSGKGGLGGTSSSASQMPNMTPEQQAALQQLLGKLTGRDNATTPYSGELSAGMTPGQNLSLSALEKQSMDVVQADTDARAALTKAMLDTGEDAGDVFSKSVEDPAIKSFKEKILPSITQRFAGNAAFGSDRQSMETKATGDLSDSLASQRSRFTFDTKQAAKDRSVKAAGMMPGVNSDAMSALMQLFSAEALPQSIQQGALDRRYQEFQRYQRGSETNISQTLAALGLQPLNTVVTPGQPGFLQGAAPGIGSALTQYALRRWLTPSTGGGDSPPTPTGSWSE